MELYMHNTYMLPWFDALAEATLFYITYTIMPASNSYLYQTFLYCNNNNNNNNNEKEKEEKEKEKEKEKKEEEEEEEEKKKKKKKKKKKFIRIYHLLLKYFILFSQFTVINNNSLCQYKRNKEQRNCLLHIRMPK
jgi:chemotaxis protein histidine kinase CheA